MGDALVKSTSERSYERGRERGAAFLAGPHPRLAMSKARGIARQLGWPLEMLVEKVAAYDRERIDAMPDLIRYPELRGSRDQIEAGDRGMRYAGVSNEMIALHRTLDFFLLTRLYEQTGRAYYAEPGVEECRVLYVPDSEVGPVHAKNVDGPLDGWEPILPTPPGTPWFWNHPIVLDGVGSGLHIDEVPPEIFPVNIYDLCYDNCATLSEATELLTRYNYFWGHGNLLVRDNHGNSMAFEKTQCRIATRGPNRHGMNFISGMGALDPGIREHQRRMRQKYLDQVGRDWDGSEGRFWRESDQTYANMAMYVERLPARPTLREINELMERHDPGGPLCYIGEKTHPQQPGCWTVEMRVFLLDEYKLIRRQVRDRRPAYLDEPEVISFQPPKSAPVRLQTGDLTPTEAVS